MSTIDKINATMPVQFRSQVPEQTQEDKFRIGTRSECLKANSTNETESNKPLNSSPSGLETYFLKVLDTLSGQVRVIFETQMIWSLRASEVLDITNRDIFNTGLIHIRAKKGSNDRFISSRSILLLKNHNPIYADFRIFLISYTAYYNALRKIGFSMRSKNARINNTVTHAFRKYNLNYISLATGIDIQTLMNYSGHKSLSGIGYYLGNNALK